MVGTGPFGVPAFRGLYETSHTIVALVTSPLRTARGRKLAPVTPMRDLAHERGTPVSVHVTISQDLARALDAGMDDIAHMVTDKVPDELIARMVESDTYWVPTIELWQGVSRNYPVSYGATTVDNLFDGQDIENVGLDQS